MKEQISKDKQVEVFFSFIVKQLAWRNEVFSLSQLASW